MCVIAYFPKESKEPKREDLLAMWNANPNGAGIMWKEKDGVHFSKGYFDFDEFYKDFLIIKRDYNFTCGVHFRIATSGGINQAMCHPFPLTNNKNEIKKIWGKTDCAIMHNGILPIETPHPDLNDTCEFILNYMFPRYARNKSAFIEMSNDDKKDFEKALNGNKLLVFDKRAIKLYGNWYKKDDYYVSNLHWNYKHKYYWDKEYWDYLDKK